MKASQITHENLTKEVVDKVLFDGIEDCGAIGDCIMVLSSSKAYKYRIPKAIELYKAGRGKKILTSGKNEVTDMREQLICSGIPREDIIVDDRSLNTVENFVCSLYLLNKEFQLAEMKSILLVTTSFHMKRSLMWAETLMPRWMKIVPCAVDDTNTRRSNWFVQEESRKRAIDEVYKIAQYVRAGCFPDFEV